MLDQRVRQRRDGVAGRHDAGGQTRLGRRLGGDRPMQATTGRAARAIAATRCGPIMSTK
jgi:hypothetical protein